MFLIVLHSKFPQLLEEIDATLDAFVSTVLGRFFYIKLDHYFYNLGLEPPHIVLGSLKFPCTQSLNSVTSKQNEEG